MKRIEKLNNFLIRKKWLYASGSVFLYFTFRESIEQIIQKVIVTPIAIQVDSVWHNDIFFSPILLIVILYTVHRFRRYVQSLNFALSFLACSIIYLFYRISGETWIYTSLSFYDPIKYADLLLGIAVSQLLLLVPSKKKKRENNPNSFSEDQPLGEDSDDELGYNNDANQLASKINDSHFKKAFAIGINGKWGLGKTSFIDLLKRKIKVLDEKKDVIEVNFNPWNSSHPKAIIKDFFDSLQEKINPYHSSISRMLVRYSNKLVALYNNKITQAIQVSIATVTGIESISSL